MGSYFFCVRFLKSEGRQSGREDGCEVWDLGTDWKQWEWGNPQGETGTCIVSHYLQASMFYDGNSRKSRRLCYEAKYTLIKELERLKKDLEGVGVAVGPGLLDTNKVRQQVSAVCACWESIPCADPPPCKNTWPSHSLSSNSYRKPFMAPCESEAVPWREFEAMECRLSQVCTVKIHQQLRFIEFCSWKEPNAPQLEVKRLKTKDITQKVYSRGCLGSSVG